MNKYVLDACVFIDANQRYYGLNFCPAFWEWLILNNRQGRIYSIDLVLSEILPKKDYELYHWSRTKGNCLFQDTVNSDIEEISREIEAWLVENNFTSQAIEKFKDGADIGLIAFAKIHNHKVVTLEKGPGSIHKIKIPEVCKGLNVQYVDTFEMIRTESPEFVLNKKSES